MSNSDTNNKLDNLSVDGIKISPVLKPGIKNYLIDIDGTICDDIPNEEPERMVTAKLYPDALITLNKWYDQGHILCFFTSRTEEHRKVTENWLKKNDHICSMCKNDLGSFNKKISSDKKLGVKNPNDQLEFEL